jgi:CRISPR-associated endonuclease/helicase Cas3
MAELTAEQFADFFQAVHSTPEEVRQPFDWQKRLAEQVLGSEGWPDVIRVPTSCGKTSVLDIALFELAVQATSKPEQITAARRICFVVDRRLVVDEVTAHADRLYREINAAKNGNNEVLKVVAQALESLAAKQEPLRVVRLRGGTYRDDGWAADPLTPTIIVSTVDQIGSRLLFRGYGVSRRSRPLQAGLLAFDTRIILDEAHLSTVFAETLDRVRQYQQWAEQSPLPKERLVSIVRMSATAGESQRVFELNNDERKDARLRTRLEASKPAELITVQVESITKDMRQKQPRKARELERENRAKLVKQLVKTAEEFGRNGPAVIGVVVNRVATAREVFEQLQKKGEGEPEREVLLLTGRIRPYDRDRLLQNWLPKIKAGRDTNPDRVLFVVATQTVEVGANIDFDALVTEAAPLDALRQRFGRLHRIPDQPSNRPDARAAILIRSDQARNSEDDPIYGEAIARTWRWLSARQNTASRRRSRRTAQPTTVDFGINDLDPKLPKTAEEMRPLLAPQPDAPLLFPAHLDAWVQTNPMPDPNPDVGPFLHGPADAAADVQVIWRADLDESNRKVWPDIVRLMPPRIREALPVPLYELRAWLRKSAEGDVADIEGVHEREQYDPRATSRRVLRWRGLKDVRVVGPDKIKPGDTVIVPSSYGGADEFGWNPQSTVSVPDIGDTCLAQIVASYPASAFRRPKLRLRVHPLLIQALVTEPAKRMPLEAHLQAAVSVAIAEDGDPWPTVKQILPPLGDARDDDGAFSAAVNALAKLQQPPHVDVYPDGRGIVLIAAIPLSLPDEKPALTEDVEHEDPEDDESSLSPTMQAVLLTDHTTQVKQQVGEFAVTCGISDALKKALELAALWHDQGKRDRRFQAWLQGSELRARVALKDDKPLAKSGRDPGKWGSSSTFGYPRGLRHEFVSVRLLEAALGGHADKEELVDLARLLIGTHHGYGRAFAPVTTDKKCVRVSMNNGGKPVEVCSDHRLYRLDSGWVDLFWRMIRRYGWWGLAYLESLLITADHLASARERQQPVNQEKEAVG